MCLLLQCMLDVSRLLEGKVLVGHALHNDLDVLMMNHHRTMIRDTATYKPYMRVGGWRSAPRGHSISISSLSSLSVLSCSSAHTLVSLTYFPSAHVTSSLYMYAVLCCHVMCCAVQPHGQVGGKMRPRSLRELTKQYLGLTIQEGEHDPVSPCTALH
jgi:hypothetical protein